VDQKVGVCHKVAKEIPLHPASSQELPVTKQTAMRCTDKEQSNMCKAYD
jgi:hypothetical protein